MLLTELSFAIAGNAWSPSRCGDYAADCATGRLAAAEMIAFIREHQTPQAFGFFARAITEAGCWDGVEIGFFSVLGITICNPAVGVGHEPAATP